MLPRAEEVARAAQAQVLLRDLEPVVGARQHREAVGRAGRRPVDEHAQAPDAAAPDAASELMELGEPEALRVLHDEHRRVGDVHPHLDHDRRDEHVEVAAAERLDRLVALGRLHAPVDEAHAAPGQRAAPRLASRRRVPEARAVRLLDQRVDDEGLAAGRELLAHARQHALPLRGPDHPRRA
ncbi:MAG TPA: hypothetical protein VND21_12455, partial [Planctomycetota bacterium]|nr:hypothetical protein [Planctomycetota bacterium]